MKTNPHINTGISVLLALLKPVDWLIDCRNLFHNGFGYANGKWYKRIILDDGTDDTVDGDLVRFSSRRHALEYMNHIIAREAVLAAIKKLSTNFSGKSRNAPCPCGSGKKFKLCCMAHD